MTLFNHETNNAGKKIIWKLFDYKNVPIINTLGADMFFLDRLLFSSICIISFNIIFVNYLRIYDTFNHNLITKLYQVCFTTNNTRFPGFPWSKMNMVSAHGFQPLKQEININFMFKTMEINQSQIKMYILKCK